MLQRLAVVLCAAFITTACGQTDAGITTAVKSKFAADDTVKAYEIDVTTQNKVVTLEGNVETSVAKDKAIALARDTDGVRDVVDKLNVSESAATSGVLDEPDTRSDTDRAKAKAGDTADKAGDTADKAGAAVGDAAITSAVKSKLLADPDVGGLKIDVDTKGGIVTLSGDVASRAEATQAVKMARGTSGVERVVDNLKVGKP
jgi:hyperosmotically inducible periplasmic protein